MRYSLRDYPRRHVRPHGAGVGRIPVTHRTLSRSFAAVTGRLAHNEPAENLSLPDADTLIFLMAVKTLPKLVARIVSEKRFAPDTPAALIQNGTLPNQRVVVGPLNTIVKLKEQRRVEHPAVLVVGQTAAFAANHEGRKPLPFAGIRTVVLRTPEQSGKLTDLLSDLVATVILYPIIKIEPRTEEPGRIERKWLESFTSFIFTSPNGAGIFMQSLFEKGIDSRIMCEKTLYAIGSAMGHALEHFGIIPDGLPDRYVAEGLLDIIPTRLHDRRICIPRAAKARDVLPNKLKERGAIIRVLPVYDTVANDLDHRPIENDDFVLFTSSSTVDCFYKRAECASKSIVPCCMGPVTAQSLESHYHGETAVAPNATVEALVDTVTVRANEIRSQKGNTL
ncbi:MAG: hypothetical protein GF344_15325 [Chitinivibrionales bacterium]|nr:hypothetical protein [Chitinivibrionales bacterium]MBD3358077.1 hypothetical protein [Chitinivibrionales bacterium]